MAEVETWAGLNAVVREADEAECIRLLRAELKGKKRKQFVFRLHSRLNKVRADRERSELWGALYEQKAVKWLR